MFKTSIFKDEHNSESLRERFHGSDSLPLKVSIKAAARMIKIYWTSKESLFSWFILTLIIALTSGAIYLAKVFNTWYKEFWDTVQQYNLEGFKHQLILFAILATIHVVVSVYNSYLRSVLAIRWRRFFTTRVMRDYLDSDTYYKMQLEDRKTENPDQRISEDLSSFVSYTISLLLGTASDLAMLGTFGVVLWDLSYSVTMEVFGYSLHLPNGYMLYLGIIYALVGTLITFKIGKPLVRLNFRQQRFEADFRFSLIRVRENAESISLYKGHASEERYLGYSFSEVVKNYIRLIKREKTLGFFTLGYAQTAVIFPILIAAPMYFAKIITIGSIMQINSAFGRVQDSLSTVISSFSSWANYKAVVDRLALFFDSMDSSNEIKCLKPQFKGGSFKVLDLDLFTPVSKQLCSKLNLELKSDCALLIRGPSGCGKSTFIKTIAGIWPHAQGQISLPENRDSLFLSQRPYLPQGSLRDAIYYPNVARNDGLAEKYLEQLSLTHLIKDLDKVDNYSSMLSLGEQQRIAIIRALILKPGLLFLDEASSALDEELEKRAYTMIREELKRSLIISVGHRSSLIKMHDYILNAKADMKWTLDSNNNH